MANLIIGDKFTEVFYNDKADLYRTDVFFGNILHLLEENYPKMVNNRDYALDYMRDYVFNNNSFKINFELWGMAEGYSALKNMYDFLLYNDSIKLSFREVEELRLKYHFESYHYSDTYFDGDEYILENEKSYTWKTQKNVV